MELHALFVGNLFLVRWDTPCALSCAEVRTTFAVGRGRRKPFYVAVLPRDMPELGPAEIREFVDLTRELLPLCAHVAVVIEARGARGAALRTAMSAVRVSDSRHYSMSMVDSIPGALNWAPGPLPEPAELNHALTMIGRGQVPASRVA